MDEQSNRAGEWPETGQSGRQGLVGPGALWAGGKATRR